jgi:hypothetical protein
MGAVAAESGRFAARLKPAGAFEVRQADALAWPMAKYHPSNFLRLNRRAIVSIARIAEMVSGLLESKNEGAVS